MQTYNKLHPQLVRSPRIREKVGVMSQQLSLNPGSDNTPVFKGLLESIQSATMAQSSESASPNIARSTVVAKEDGELHPPKKRKLDDGQSAGNRTTTARRKTACQVRRRACNDGKGQRSRRSYSDAKTVLPHAQGQMRCRPSHLRDM